MPAQPLGDPAPLDGRISFDSAVRLQERDFSLYVHVPFCSVRCGYCDFNTYATVDFGNGVGANSYADDAIAELEFARRVLHESGAPTRKLYSVFFGGGTPTKLPAADLVKILARSIDLFGLEDGAEVTTEANPDSVTLNDLLVLKAGGFTRVSFGMQSVVPEVLAVLDRTHSPANVPKVVAWAREAGLQVSVDLIYGAPGETLEQWEQTLRAAISYEPDHISAYSLIVEEGTKLAAQIRRGDLTVPDEDSMADKYLLTEKVLNESGYRWYEISNYAKSPKFRSRHNYVYWRNQDWWGVGPGAHSHVDGTRWWNLKHPVPYANRVRKGLSPAAAREVLGQETRHFEDIMLMLRVVDGLPVDRLLENQDESQVNASLGWLRSQGLIDVQALEENYVRLTLSGRLLGDAVTRELLPDLG